MDGRRREEIGSEEMFYFLAKVIFIAWLGLILNPWRESLADPAWNSFSNSTKAMSCLPGTRRTSLNPGYWTNSIWMSCSLVSSGRFVRKRIEFGGCSTRAECGIPPCVLPPFSFLFFRAGSSSLPVFSRSWKVPFSFEITSESVLANAILWKWVFVIFWFLWFLWFFVIFFYQSLLTIGLS